MSYLYLFLAIIFEIIGTSFMKVSNGFSVLMPTIVTFISYVLCFMFFAQALKTLDVSIAYATWSALGLAVIAIIGFIFFQETVSISKIAFLVLIVIGVVGLNLCGIKH